MDSQGIYIGWFYDPTYRSNIYVMWPEPGKKLTTEHVNDFIRKKFNKKDGPALSDSPFGAKTVELYHNGMQVNLICFHEWPKKPCAMDYSFLAHEAFHCAEHILAVRGVSLHTQVSTEPYAYLIESIVRRCLDLICK